MPVFANLVGKSDGGRVSGLRLIRARLDGRQISIFIARCLPHHSASAEKVVVTIALPRLHSRARLLHGDFKFFPPRDFEAVFLAVGTAAKTWHFMGCTPGPAGLSRLAELLRS